MTLRELTPWRSSRAPARYRDLSPFRAFHRDIDRLFDEFFGSLDMPMPRGENRGFATLSPRLDVTETDKAYEVSVELPGIDEKDVELTLADGVLALKGAKKVDSEHKGTGRVHIERSFGSFRRSLSLPTDADEEKVTAAFKNGVLTVTLPKKPEAQPHHKKIEIKSV